MIKNQTPLSAARKFEREASKQISEKDRPLFHLTPMGRLDERSEWLLLLSGRISSVLPVPSL